MKKNEQQKNTASAEKQPDIGVESEELSQNGTVEASAELSQEKIDEIVDELAATPKPKRIWEVDFLRGFMILFVVWDHLMSDVFDFAPYKTVFFQKWYQFTKTYYAGSLRAVTHDAFVTLFVFTSGISCSFSRSNGKRAIKMMSFALLFTAITVAVESIAHVHAAIYFNVIHVIALSVTLWTAIEWCWSKCNRDWQKNVFGAVMAAVIITVLIVGSIANTNRGAWTNNNPMWFFLVNHKDGNFMRGGADYLPFFPDFGWFLVGAFLGKFLYREKKSLFPSVNPKWVSPITFCGRYSIWIYFGSQIVMYGLIYLLAGVFGIL